jgi:hypothetical protein
MRIIKDVIIAGAIEPVWDQVIAESQAYIESSEGSNEARPDVLVFSPPSKLSYKTLAGDLSLITTLELTRRGKRTGLRVTVAGWEDVRSERVRAEMPRLSLEWEKALARIRHYFETTTI